MESSYQPSFKEKFIAAMFIWKMTLSDLAVLTLVFLLVCWVPIANIGFFAGYTRSILKVARGEGRAEVGDIFKAWDCFGNLLVYVILLVIASAILHLVPVLGALATLALGVVAAPGLYAIIDGKLGTVDAIKWSIQTIQAKPADWVLAFIAGYFISMLGLVLLGIGIILTLPLGTLILVQQYESAKPA